MTDIATRKLHFIEKYLRLDDEDLINKLEAVLLEEKKLSSSGSDKPSVYDFVGVLGEKEAEQMKKDIQDACEKIDEDEW